MNGKQFKNLLVDDIAAAIKAGLLPEYEYKVRITSGKFSHRSVVNVYTWIATVESVRDALESIFQKHVEDFDGYIVLDVLEPIAKTDPLKSYNENLEHFANTVKSKVDEFYRVNPAWARR
jgi:hypothetical protein